MLSAAAVACIIACSSTTVRRIAGGEYEVHSRRAEEPESLVRELDKSLLLKAARAAGKSDTGPDKAESSQPQEKKEAKTSYNLRRKRVQLRRNRYLLLQED